MVKILMARSIAGDYPTLAKKRKDRYNFRARAAERMNLNFRYVGKIVVTHGIHKNLKERGYILGARGLCAVCGRETQVCACKIIVRDASGAVVREI
jgi:hypothetical protein